MAGVLRVRGAKGRSVQARREEDGCGRGEVPGVGVRAGDSD